MAAATASSVGVEFPTKEEQGDLEPSGINTWSYVQRWKAFREHRKDAYKKVAGRAAVRRKLSERSSQKRLVHRSMPLELLAREWLNEQRASIENRAYLVDKVLPTLVIGIEKLLNEVSLRGLEETEGPHPDFNPVNYLAQYLMRNNPRYSNFAEAHPYCRSMKEVSEELKRLAFSVDENRLAQLKAHTRQRRVEREKQDALKAQEEERRTLALTATFSKWTLPGEVELPLLQVLQAVKFWLEVMKEHAFIATLRESFSNLLQAGDISDKLLREKDFVDEVMGCASELPVDVFNVLVEHLEMCGAERRRNKMKGERRELFNGVFSDCAPDKTGFVDRLRVVHLFGRFYDSAAPGDKNQLHNPRKWPVVELIEDEEWEDEEEKKGEGLEGSPAPLSEQDYQEFLTGSALETTPTSAKSQGGEEKAASEPTKTAEASDGSVASPETQPTQPQGGGSPTEAGSEGEPGAKNTTAESGPEKGSYDGGTTREQSAGSREEAVNPPGEEAGAESRPTAFSRGKNSISKSRRLSGMSSRPVTPSGPGSVWDHCLLRKAQFVQLVELFLGEEPHSVLEGSLAAFIRESYCETEQERAERQEQAQLHLVATARRRRANLFSDAWDNDRSSYLEIEELKLVLPKWKGFSSERAQEQAEVLSSLGAEQGRLTRQQFHSYFQQLTEGMSLEEFEEFSDYLMASVKLTFEELRRGERRQEFLSQIVRAGKTSGLQFMEALKTATSVLQQDGSEFGSGKQCSIALSLLEPSRSTGDPCLQFKVASSDCQSYVVGRKLLRSHKQVSYQAVEAGRPVHVPNIQKHGGVFFFCPDHKTEEFNGSLVVAPIVSPQRQVMGTLSVDTLTNSEGLETTFQTHEINFYEGVGVCLGEVFHWIDSLRKLLRVAQSALSWVHRRCPQVPWAEVYIMEPALSGEENDSYALRLMLQTTSDNSPGSTQAGSTQAAGERFQRRDNLFKEYLFQCVDHSEPVSTSACGRHHLAFPVRDHTGCAVVVVDLCMPPTHSLQPQQAREVTRVLKLLTVAYHRISCVPEPRKRREGEESVHGEGSTHDSTSTKGGGEEDVSVLFDQLMLADLRENIGRLDNRMFAELRSYAEPPEVVLHTLQALLLILHPQQEFMTWAQCRQYITLALVKALVSYNPLAQGQHPRLSQVRSLLQGIPADSVTRHSSLPTKYIHRWVTVCVSLLEHTASPAGTTLPASDTQSSSKSNTAAEPTSS